MKSVLQTKRTIHKSVQAWMSETTHQALDIAKRIEKAIALNVSAQYASRPFQVNILPKEFVINWIQITGYGLGGLVEEHHDSYGYIEGVELTDDRR